MNITEQTKHYSKAGVGMYASAFAVALQTIFRAFGIDFDEGVLTELFLAVFTVVSISFWIYGQIDRKDLSYGIFRKQ